MGELRSSCQKPAPPRSVAAIGKEQRVCQLSVPLVCQTVAPRYHGHAPCDLAYGRSQSAVQTDVARRVHAGAGIRHRGQRNWPAARRRTENRGRSRQGGACAERRGEDLRNRFLGTISHELRTPLNAIIGWAQMLRSGRLSTSDVDHAVAAIDRNARLEVQLIEDLLDVSRMQRGRLRVRREPVDLVAVVTEVTNSLRHAAETAGVDVARRHA